MTRIASPRSGALGETDGRTAGSPSSSRWRSTSYSRSATSTGNSFSAYTTPSTTRNRTRWRDGPTAARGTGGRFAPGAERPLPREVEQVRDLVPEHEPRERHRRRRRGRRPGYGRADGGRRRPLPPVDGRPSGPATRRRPDHLRLRQRPCRSASARRPTPWPRSTAARTGSRSRLDRVPTGPAGRGARRRGPRLLRARRRRPGRHRPGRCTPTSAARASQQGGSTITQQYVKNVYLDQRAHASAARSRRRCWRSSSSGATRSRDPRALPEHDLLRARRLRRAGRRRRRTSARTSATSASREAALPRRADPLARRRRRRTPHPEEAKRRRRDRARRDGSSGG